MWWKVAVGLILARKNSKRLPNKNIADLGGRPLLQWSIEALKDSRVISDVYVSTDSEQYGRIANNAGAETIWRPPELCTDTATSEDSVAHALEVIESIGNVVVLSQCTSPLTKPETIFEAIRAVENGYDTALSVVKAKRKPFWAFEMADDGRLRPFMSLPENSPFSSETPPDLYYPTGGVYAFRVDFFQQTHRIYGGNSFGVKVSPLEAIDIDDEFDLHYAEYALTLLKNEVTRRHALPNIVR